MTISAGHLPLHLVIPGTPPSVNHYKMRTRKGVTFVSKEAKRFKQTVAAIAGGRKVHNYNYYIGVDYFLGKGQRLDIDNGLKVLFDALKECGCIHSDAAIRSSSQTVNRDWKNPRTEVTIVPVVKVLTQRR